MESMLCNPVVYEVPIHNTISVCLRSQSDRAIRQRGSVEVTISEVIQTWFEPPSSNKADPRRLVFLDGGLRPTLEL